MPRGIGRPKGRKSSLNPFTHGGHRLEVRQRREPSRTQNKLVADRTKKAKSMNTRTKISAARVDKKRVTRAGL